MTISHNAPAVAARYRSAAAAIQASLHTELQGLAGEVAARMKINAPKDLTALTNSIRVHVLGALKLLVKPDVAYDLWVEKGRKPGKGLPRFATGLPAVEWLRRRLVDAARATDPKFRKARKGSKRADDFEAELETRYLAWSRHVKQHGIKPHPYVKPTADDFRTVVPDRLLLAVRRGAQAFHAARAGT